MQDPPLGPADDELLQVPSTASSGRKPITDTRGDSYGSFLFRTSSSGINPSPHDWGRPPHPPQPPGEATDGLFRMGNKTCGLVHSLTLTSFEAILRADSSTES